MTNYDIYLSKKYSFDTLKSVLRKIVALGEEEIVVVSEITGCELPSACRLLVKVSYFQGLAQQLVELYFQNGSRIHISIEDFSTKLCSELDCKTYISDDDINPYSLVEIIKNGSKRKIFFKAQALDDNNEFIELSID